MIALVHELGKPIGFYKITKFGTDNRISAFHVNGARKCGPGRIQPTHQQVEQVLVLSIPHKAVVKNKERHHAAIRFFSPEVWIVGTPCRHAMWTPGGVWQVCEIVAGHHIWSWSLWTRNASGDNHSFTL